MECPELQCFGHFGLFRGIRFHLNPDLDPPVAEMGHACHACICKTKYMIHDSQKVKRALLHREAYKLLFVCFLCSGCHIQHAEVLQQNRTQLENLPQDLLFGNGFCKRG